MVFSDYMNELPNVKVETINEIAKLTCSTPLAVYRWINGSCELFTLSLLAACSGILSSAIIALFT